MNVVDDGLLFLIPCFHEFVKVEVINSFVGFVGSYIILGVIADAGMRGIVDFFNLCGCMSSGACGHCAVHNAYCLPATIADASFFWWGRPEPRCGHHSYAWRIGGYG